MPRFIHRFTAQWQMSTCHTLAKHSLLRVGHPCAELRARAARVGRAGTCGPSGARHVDGAGLVFSRGCGAARADSGANRVASCSFGSALRAVLARGLGFAPCGSTFHSASLPARTGSEPPPGVSRGAGRLPRERRRVVRRHEAPRARVRRLRTTRHIGSHLDPTLMWTNRAPNATVLLGEAKNVSVLLGEARKSFGFTGRSPEKRPAPANDRTHEDCAID